MRFGPGSRQSGSLAENHLQMHYRSIFRAAAVLQYMRTVTCAASSRPLQAKVQSTVGVAPMNWELEV